MKRFTLLLLIGNALPIFADPSSCYETRSSTVTTTESEVSASTFCLACERLTVTAISELACSSMAIDTSVATLSEIVPETIVLDVPQAESSAPSMVYFPDILQPTLTRLLSSQSSAAAATASSSLSSIDLTFLSKSETLSIGPSISGTDMKSMSHPAIPTAQSTSYTNSTSGTSIHVSGNQTSSPSTTLATYTGGSPSSEEHGTYSFGFALAAACLGILL